jgi:hypothetical protein
MALNTANDAIEAKRLELVAALRLRGRTQREIQQALAQQMLNPQTGEPYSLGTINGDIKKLERQWRKSAADTIEEHKARQLAEIGEVKRQAWLDKDAALVLRAIDTEANITGTKAATKQEVTGANGGPIQTQVFDHSAATAAIARRSSGYRGASGADENDSDGA